MRMSGTDADRHAKQIRQKGGWDKSRLTDDRGTLQDRTAALSM